jgi:hypothetical protein
VFGDDYEIADYRQAESKAHGVALDCSDADEISGSEGAFEFEDAGGFLADGGDVASGAFATGAKDVASGADYEDAS